MDDGKLTVREFTIATPSGNVFSSITNQAIWLVRRHL